MKKRSLMYVVSFLLIALIAAGATVLYKLSASSPASPSTTPSTNQLTATSCGVLPLDVVLVLDRSGSMVEDSTKSGTPPQNRLYYAKEAAKSLVNQLDQNGGVGGRNHPEHEVGLVSFGGLDSAGVTVDAQLGNNDATTINSAIDSMVGFGGTPFRQAMSAAESQMTQHKRTLFDGKTVQHVIIFLSDGSPDPAITTTPSPTEITNYLKSADMAYSIAVGEGGTGANGVDIALMKKIAKPTPEKFRQVTTGDQLTTLFSDIFTEIACKSANLSLTKAVDKVTPNQNDIVTFSLTLNNSGPDTAEGITIKDVLPTGLEASGTLPAGYDGTNWTVSSIATGNKATLSLLTKVTAAGGTIIKNIAEVMTSSIADPNSTPGNGVESEDDYATASLTVATTQVVTPPVTVTPPPTPVVTTTPKPAPAAAPSSGLGGYGQIIYGLLAIAVIFSGRYAYLRFTNKARS